MRIGFKEGFIVALLAALAVLPPLAVWSDEVFYIDLFSRVLIHAIAAVSLNFILGYGGMVSFGHAAYLGIGGYVVGICTFHALEDGIGWLASGWLQFPLAMLISALVALAIGAICLRTRGVYFIMITLAFGQMLYFSAVGLEVYGADDGLTLYTTSDFSGLVNLGDDVTLYYVSYVALLVALWLSWRLIGSRFGRAIAGARSNERRMQAIGFPTYSYKLTAFVIAGGLCGFAGALMANHDTFVSPSMMHWIKSGDLIIMVVLGGMGTLFGPVVGAVAFLFLEELLSSITEHWQVIFGPLLIVVVIFARGGIDGLLGALGGARGVVLPFFGGRSARQDHRSGPEGGLARHFSADGSAGAPTAAAGSQGPLPGLASAAGDGPARPALTAALRIDNVVKSFGGLLATDHLTLEIASGEIHAVIGPNGAGKTTLIAQITGELRPDRGRIHFRGRDITALSTPRRSHLGLARSFQITNLFLEFSALDNVALAIQAHSGHSFRFWREARGDPALHLPARRALGQVGLGARTDVLASNLAHGEQRQLEIAMALATGPGMLLLDEPMAGMGPEESARMVQTLRALKGRLTILLIEHDMDAVFALADRITVLEYGSAIATGTPEEIRGNEEVRQAYLGDAVSTA
ncbi:MAG: branched-chain amino acid ABC transporter ATP-binding protein/permease [Candidatus Lambdaproteobacteria bacterium]|nr:branched-chain amino acid ABC transporter ATP-binding protein/permease [Candidatus Lambdaproteobacteria bacterium]